MRIYNVDFLRGLAVSMVLLFHASSSTLPYIEESPLHKAFIIGKYGVEIFFVISGYIICYSLFQSNYTIKNLFKFLAKRIVRINPASYLLMIAYLLIELFTYIISERHLILSNPFDIKLMVSNFLFLTSTFDTDLYIATFWTLEIEFQFYLLIAASFPLLTNKSILIRHIVLGGILLFGFLNIPLALNGFIACFLLGITYFMLQFGYISRTMFAISCIFLISTFLNNGQYYELFFSFFSLILISRKNQIKSKVFQFLGKISYSLYIIHIFVFTYLDVILNKLDLSFFHESIHTKVFIILSYSGFAILISAVYYQYIEKPFIHFSKRIKLN